MLENTVTKKFVNLVNAASGDEEVLEVVERSMNSFMLYVQSVYAMEIRLPIIKFTKEGQDLCDAITELDRSRRHAHEGAIASCNVLNRICKAFNVEPLFDGNSDDRLAVADFCMDTVTAFFKERKGTDRTLSIKDWHDAAQEIG